MRAINESVISGMAGPVTKAGGNKTNKKRRMLLIFWIKINFFQYKWIEMGKQNLYCFAQQFF